MLTEIAVLDELLDARADAIGRDFVAYRNHAYRVANLCLAFAPTEPDRLEKIAVATAFHDMGVWTDGTFDYLEPSVRLATAHLSESGRQSWIPEIAEMILQHHKISRCRPEAPPLVEAFRRADWVDVSKGVLTFGLSRALVREIRSVWPDAGFHMRLVQLTWHRLGTHPLSPLPMLRL